MIHELINIVNRTSRNGIAVSTAHFSKEIVFYNANDDVIATYDKKSGRLSIVMQQLAPVQPEFVPTEQDVAETNTFIEQDLDDRSADRCWRVAQAISNNI